MCPECVLNDVTLGTGWMHTYRRMEDADREPKRQRIKH